MGTLIGHVAPGVGFLLIGLWHLFNHIKLHLINPKAYFAPPWFPCAKFRYLELLLIISGSLASISMELFIGPEKHQPLDDDGTIPSNHLHNFEHASISLAFLTYAAFSVAFDRADLPSARRALTQLLGAVAFAQQWLTFHLHSADHMGVEGQYHWLLQLVIAVSLATTLLGVPYPRSFIVSFVRSTSIAFQGVWFIVMGFMLWTPSLIPKGCFLNVEDGHQVVRCRSGEALDRAKSLVNLEFAWYMSAMAVLVMLFYMFMSRIYRDDSQYLPMVREDIVDQEEEEEKEEEEDEEVLGTQRRFMEQSFKPLNLER